MDITKFIVSSRDQALLYGDYATYRAQLSKKLLNSRKKLKIATKNRGKYSPKTEVTAEQIAENVEYLHLQLLTSERAWAHAMTMKAAHAADSKGISSHTRSHIVSRLDKAAKVAERLVNTLSDSTSGAGETDVLEAQGYAALLRGAALFEKQSWQACLKNYAVARAIYGALSASTKETELFKDLLSETIDPSIRYAAYQLKTPRTLPIPAIARKAFPYEDKTLVEAINRRDSSILKQGPQDTEKDAAAAENVPRTLTWRSREVHIEDAAIAQAWASLETAKATLAEKLTSADTLLPKDKAAAYDDVLTASQDAADATKQAIDELRGEGVAQSDPRMQSLQITRTAVNYETISWRIGRNRVLTGDRDGALVDFGPSVNRKRKVKEDPEAISAKEERPGRQITRLKEKVVLYDGTLQSLESIKELPGVAADEGLSGQLDATFQYFNALKCLAIARSYTLISEPVNALALTKFAYEQCQAAIPTLAKETGTSETAVRNIDVGCSDVEYLDSLLRGELQRCRALVEIANLQKQSNGDASVSGAPALIDRLGEYPAGGVDLQKIVVYPPKLETVPVKPLFLDVAWNYIGYPDKQAKPAAVSKGTESVTAEEKQPQKRGWFGFGR
ncbi:Signal recognition particle subunit SRP68 [Pleurostoma richardsiae]|uniref:Signal recognition particle subunit SRP68 n=1 Tax=Pleurostoma richardsiae TaxID=41990 RepID=A0AA38VRX2_9PEZI|nr:Signal recognition particle subunit SRP68 [Pleurostoma richardsiae]